MFLGRRGLVLTEEQRQQIVTCVDLAALDRWLDLAFSVTSVNELLGNNRPHAKAAGVAPAAMSSLVWLRGAITASGGRRRGPTSPAW